VQSVVPRIKSLSLALPLIRRNPLLYGRLSRFLEAFESWEPERQRAWRESQLARMLAAAGRTPYGERLGAPRRLGDWPILSKEPIRAAPRDFVSRRHRLAVPATTSGTTGTPLTLRRSFTSIVYEQAVIDRMMSIGGASPRRARIAVLRGDDIKAPDDRTPPFWRHVGSNQLVFSSHHLNRQTLEHFARAAGEFAPEVLFAYPSALESLCALMLARGMQLRIPLTLCGSEVLTSATIEAARLALSTRVISYYGQAERVAWADDSGGGYRFLGSYSANELRLVETTSEADTFELVGTSLWNTAMPLVRYHTGDRFLLAKGSDPVAVAEGRAPILGIVGRQGDYLVSPEGARLIGINHIPRGVPRLLRAQFVQESPERVRVLVIPGAGFDDECRRTLLEHAARKLPSSMRISIEVTDQLLRTPSGKTPLVLRPFESGSGPADGVA
jgi:phenylacetate-CoA ligase